MPFSEEIKRSAMVACGRHCCICHKFCGNNMEVHHIKPQSKGGADTFENAIPLCFDCHAEVGQYNPEHPKGIKFSEKELIEHRDRWYRYIRENGGKTPESNHKTEPIRRYRQKGFEKMELRRIASGRELLNRISGSSAMEYYHDEPKTREEAEIIGDFFQTVREIMDSYLLYEPKDYVVVGFDLNELVEEMDKVGFWIFAEKETQKLRGGIGLPEDFIVLHIWLVRKDSPDIIWSGDPKNDLDKCTSL